MRSPSTWFSRTLPRWQAACVAGWNGWRGLRSRHPRAEDTQPLAETLRSADTGLARATASLETQFLAVGSGLMELTRFAKDFLGQVERLVGLATGQQSDGELFERATAAVNRSAQFLIDCHEQTRRILDGLRGYASTIEDLLRAEADLERTMAPLRYVQTLFRVESAPLGPEVQEMFQALTEEIERLHRQVSDNFGREFQKLQQSHDILGVVVGKLQSLVESLDRVRTTHQPRIERSLAEMREEFTANRQREARLNHLGRAIDQEVEQVVIGLQYQDIVAQKFQHIREALPQITRRLEEMGGRGRSSEAAALVESWQFCRQSARLEIEQLQAAGGDLRQADDKIRQGIRNVMEYLRQIDSDSLSLQEFKRLTTSFDGMVQALLEAIEEMGQLMKATAASAVDTHQALQPLGHMASGLTSVVNELSARILLIGLNAQVQAARVGQGAGLEVLSAHTSEISEATNQISQRVARQLDRLAEGLANDVRTFEELRGRTEAQQTAFDVEARTQEQALHAFRDAALGTLNEMAGTLAEFRDRAAATLETTRFLEECEPAVAGLRVPLETVAAAAESQLSRLGGGNAPANVVEGLRQAYTMESERQVFASVVETGQTPLPPATAAAAPVVAATPVVAASAAAAAIALGATALAEPPRAAEGAPLAADAVPAPPSSTPETAPENPPGIEAPAANDLGDNVELF